MKIENVKFELKDGVLDYSFTTDDIRWSSSVNVGTDISQQDLSEYKNGIKVTAKNFCEDFKRRDPETWEKERQISISKSVKTKL